MLQQEREINLICINPTSLIKKFKISDTHSDELNNVFFLHESIALDTYNKKIAEVFNDSKV